uniref:Uncharacterized protein n=1 Tax=Arundo donax TaxID=35708 RepID=A0A0A9D2L2_ARUDO
MFLYIVIASDGYAEQILTAFIKKNLIGRNVLLASEVPRASSNGAHHVSAATFRDSMIRDTRVKMIPLTFTFSSIIPLPICSKETMPFHHWMLHRFPFYIKSE